MQMVDCLSRPAPIVGHHAEPLMQLLFVGDVPRHLLNAPQKPDIIVRDGGEPGDVLPGHDQNMRRGLGVDVLKSNQLLVFKNDLGVDLLPDDLAEETVSHLSCILSKIR